jgi:molybdopterin-containing oxidoreductase family membrane subunit
MRGSKAVVGVFSYLDDMLNALEKVKEQGRDYRVYSPVPRHEIEHATSHTRSPIRMFTLTGALIGLTGGFALQILTALDYPLRTSAKDIVSIPAFVVVGYECTILFGALFTFAALFHFCRLPDVLRKVGYDPRFTDDKFGLVVGCSPSEADEASQLLSDSGADEVLVKEGL